MTDYRPSDPSKSSELKNQFYEEGGLSTAAMEYIQVMSDLNGPMKGQSVAETLEDFEFVRWITSRRDRAKGFTVTFKIDIEWAPEDFDTEEEYLEFEVPTDEETVEFLINEMRYNIKSVEPYERLSHGGDF